MKNYLFVLLLSIISLLANAQTAETIFESYWEGGSNSRSDLTDSGFFVLESKMYDVSYDTSDDTFTAVLLTVFNLEGDEYTSKVKMSGDFYPSTNRCVLEPSYTISYDELPGELYWINSDIELYLYKDDEHPGYFYLYGKNDGQYYDDEFYFLSNY